MDGRVQDSVNSYLKKRFSVDYIDVITEPGPVKILADKSPVPLTDSIHDRIAISIHKHQSNGIAIVAHEDCAGNPLTKEQQCDQMKKAVIYLQECYKNTTIIPLWADLSGSVTEIK